MNPDSPSRTRQLLPLLLASIALAMSQGAPAEDLAVPEVQIGPPIHANYECSGGKHLDVTYLNGKNGQSFALVPVDGVPTLLVSTVSGSGVRYQSGFVTWWNKGRNGDFYDSRVDPDKPVLQGCMATGPGTPAGPPSKDDVKQILQAERDICNAFEHEDADWLEKHLDPTFTLTSSNGKVTTRADEVADLRRGTKYDVFRNRDSKVRMYGDAAVVTGITRVGGKSDGKPYALDFQFTDTYVRKDGAWVIVASQASRLATDS
jgi:membrane-bound inhibitor of C-type lysozyme/ketosteroid isomerase-like protein